MNGALVSSCRVPGQCMALVRSAKGCEGAMAWGEAPATPRGTGTGRGALLGEITCNGEAARRGDVWHGLACNTYGGWYDPVKEEPCAKAPPMPSLGLPGGLGELGTGSGPAGSTAFLTNSGCFAGAPAGAVPVPEAPSCCSWYCQAPCKLGEAGFVGAGATSGLCDRLALLMLGPAGSGAGPHNSLATSHADCEALATSALTATAGAAPPAFAATALALHPDAAAAGHGQAAPPKPTLLAPVPGPAVVALAMLPARPASRGTCAGKVRERGGAGLAWPPLLLGPTVRLSEAPEGLAVEPCP